eukprot:TRINITY_DN872_c0_g1_i1.p1 TRINITY_DN872_c0_g1~~TRINITY_DN872_c0_g1_i1.p1  ORF type:complete len:554 (-),score=68.49 TRINITY_DN872_c0_g1_i1:22-1683(-)
MIQLPDKVVNDIDASSHIPGPCTALRSIIENSVAGGALKIEINVFSPWHFSVADDGCGVSGDALNLIGEAPVPSLGKGGLSLRRIALLGKMTLFSVSSLGTVKKIVLNGERLFYATEPLSTWAKTIVEISDLFETFPVRRLATSEKISSLQRVVEELAVLNHQVQFRGYFPGSTLYKPKVHSLHEALWHLFRLDQLQPVLLELDGLTVRGVTTPATHATMVQLVFCNNSPSHDTSLNKLICGAVSHCPRSSVVAFVETRTPPTDWTSFVEGVLKSAPKQKSGQNPVWDSGFHYVANLGHQRDSFDLKANSTLLFEWRNPCLPLNRRDVAKPCKTGTKQWQVSRLHLRKLASTGGVQFDSKFLVSVVDNLVLIVDQHAASERVRLEKLTADLLHCSAREQRLLLPPSNLSLSQEAGELLCRFAPELQRWGFTIKKISRPSATLTEHQFVVSAVPVICGNELPADAAVGFCRDLAALATVPHAVTEILNAHACRTAVKFGDHLAPEAIKALFLDLSETRLCFQCAHGRPTVAPVVELAPPKPLEVRRPLLSRLLR